MSTNGLSEVKISSILPCPFCGKSPKQLRNRNGGLVIICNSIECELLSVDGEGESEAEDQELIAAWNRRFKEQS